jgi:hypothetical protein
MSQIKTIKTVRLMGDEPRSTPNGDLWGFWLEFDDGTKGVANGKSKAPRWAEVGATVEATDSTYKTPKGHTKWKISIPREIPQDSQGYTGHQSSDGTETFYKRPNYSSNGSSGVDKGREIAIQACINQASQVAAQDSTFKSGGYNEQFKHIVYSIAKDLLEVREAIQEGRDLVQEEGAPF